MATLLDKIYNLLAENPYEHLETLLRYCELDTMSMVFLWEYFREMTA